MRPREQTARAFVSAEESLGVLIEAVQRLSLAASAEEVQRIARSAARHLTAADGATVVLRDNEECFYVDEDAIAPLWKGSRFPITACVSGWSMLHRTPVVISDIYRDGRVPHEAYRPTFVKSLVMVPIRTMDPIGAIGMYWAVNHTASQREVGLAQALADSTAIALENVRQGAALGIATQLSETDPLTGVANRRAWEAALAAATTLDSQSVCVALIDLDHLKDVNDAAGHAAGDRLLREATAAWRGVLREGDLLARLGGDEFGVLLRGCILGEALPIAERLRVEVPLQQTASIGLAQWSRMETPGSLMARADGALYAAKGAQRNVVITAD